MTIHIYCDGSCSNGLGGWGYHKLNTITKEDDEAYGSANNTSNNKMELQACIEALKSIKEPSTIILHSDSQYVIKGITSWIHNWKRNGWKANNKSNTDIANPHLWKQLDKLNSFHTVTWKWVRGHSGNEGNERADRLARLGMYEAKLNYVD